MYRAEDLFRTELLEKARSASEHGLLVCESCGWSWLTLETATIDWSLDGYGVACGDRMDCVRRNFMRMRPFVASKRSTQGKCYDFTTGRRASPLCSYDGIDNRGQIVRGEKCHCHIPGKVN